MEVEMEEQRVQGEEEEEKMYEWLKVVAWGMAEEAKVCGGGGRREVAVVDRSLRAKAKKEVAGWRQFGGDGGGKGKKKKKTKKKKKKRRRTGVEEKAKKKRQRGRWTEEKWRQHAEKQGDYRTRKKEAMAGAAEEEVEG